MEPVTANKKRDRDLTWKERFEAMQAANPVSESDGSDSETVRFPTPYVGLDCEMVGVGSDGKRSVLARVTLVNSEGSCLYDKHVAVGEAITDFRTNVSGIRPRDLRYATAFKAVQREVHDIIRGRIVVGHALKNDFKALLLDHPRHSIRDTAVYKPLRPLNRAVALRKLASEQLDVEIQTGEHSPLEDARAAMCLYLKHSKQWETYLAGKSRQSKHK